MVTTFDEMRERTVKQATEFLQAVRGPITEPLIQAALEDAFIVVLFRSLLAMPRMPKKKALTNDELREAYKMFWRDIEDFDSRQLIVDWRELLVWRLQNARAGGSN